MPLARFKCPRCQAMNNVEADLELGKVECPACHAKFTVKRRSGDTAPPPASSSPPKDEPASQAVARPVPAPGAEDDDIYGLAEEPLATPSAAPGDVDSST